MKHISVDKHDRDVLQGLARLVTECARDDRYEIRRDRWRRLNALEGSLDMPLLWVRPDDDGGWLDLIPPDSLCVHDSDLRPVEMELRKLLYQHQYFDDDFVLEPLLRLNVPGEYTGYTYGDAAQTAAWGLSIRGSGISDSAYRLDNYLDDPDNRERLLAHEVDFIQDGERLNLLQIKMEQVFEGNFHIVFTLPYEVLVQSLLIELVHLRGLSGLMLDVYDDPEGLHAVMDHMSASKTRLLRQLEREERLFNNQSNVYTGNGALGYLPLERAPKGSVKLCDMWGTADAQEFSAVSPEAFAEFVLPYQKRGLSLFGYACYGCCEPLETRIPLLLEELPRLRRVSVSPWANIEQCAALLGGRAVYSWKPNPALICGRFQETELEALLRQVQKATCKNGCHTEIILKDVRSHGGSREALQRFASLVHSVWG